MQNLWITPRRGPLWRIIAVLLLAVLAGACSPPEPPQLEQATRLPSPKPIADFRLTDQNGNRFTLQNLEGRWTLAFFGYTHCPDVCPTSLAVLGQVMRRLEQDPDAGEPPQVVFFSVDPERDTPEQLASFVPYFHDSFTGVTGDPEEILKLTRQLGILYGKTDDTDGGDYLVDHSAAIVLFDPAGRFHAVFSVPHKADVIAADFLALKSYYEAIQ
ncbi:MAG: SCO family protein [Gammaproteobacteria bacterium]|jgi:protein SCO1/2